MNKLTIIPAFISSLRIAVLPLFFYLFNLENVDACLALLSLSAATDFLDGYLARKLNVTSRFGAYWDATTDFILMFGAFAIFFAQGFYPWWLLVLIAVSFIQFLVTSNFAKRIYDPVGKYLGSALYIGIALTLIRPTHTIFIFVQYAFAVFFVVSLASRIISLVKKRP
ncbi:MAG: CDP-alcohol phosphatidyltransferase family protein [Candidatus Bathyarchaeota archaeon]|nr:CDP-alcohol phosphatidyltransferase family protein [Candidatus Bathyarchaeota archaeon]